jgi:diguanylate cyclase (GGDEF)-like protein/PAS domain S-box-containing protein
MPFQTLIFLLIFMVGVLASAIVSLVIYVIRQRRSLISREPWFHAFPDPIILIDQDDRIVNINLATEKLIGVPFKNATGLHHREVFPAWAELFAYIEAGQKAPGEIQLEVAGEVRWYYLYFSLLKNPNPDQADKLIVLHDISVFKQLESALEASQDSYRSVTEQADDGIAIIQNDLIVYVNPRLLAMTSYLPMDVLYRNFEFFIPPEHSQAARERYSRRMEGEGTPNHFETAIIRKDGLTLPVEMKIGVMTFSGKPAALATFQDITNRKQAESQLHLQSEALKAAANAFVITDSRGAIQWVNPAFTYITGYNLDEVIGRNPRILKSGKQSREFYQHLWENIRAGQVWKGELINRRKDGSFYDEHMAIAPVFDESGQITHFVAIKEDITERKRAEMALRKSEQQFRELILNTPSAMMVFGNDHQLILANRKFTEILGYTTEDILSIEQFWALACPDQDLRQQIEQEWNSQSETGILESSAYKPIEAQVTCKDASSRLVRFSLVQLEEKYIVALVDLTKQKRAENQFHQRARHLTILNEITLHALENSNLDSMCQIFADRMGELLEADGCYIVLWDEATSQAIPMAAYGPMRDTYRAIARLKGNEPFLPQAVLQAGHAIAIEDVLNSPLINARLANKFPTRSMLGLPLIADHRKLGAALISYENSHTFAPDEISRGEQAAAQVALAIAKAKLFEAENEKHQLSLALVEISTLLSADMNVEVLLTRMLDLIQRVVPYDAGHVFIVENGRTKVLFTRGYEDFDKELDEFVQNLELEIATTPNLQKMVETRRPLIISDITETPDWITPQPGELFRSWAGAPIHYNGEVLAIFSLEKQEPNFFRPEHAGRLAAFAGQAAIALENARLFEELRRIAIVDSLTGTFTRGHILDLAINEIERAQRYGNSICVVMLDIDHFKQVNDRHGHQIGDLVLQKIIALCRKSLRKTDLIGRYGGEEFLILLPETQIIQAVHVAERIRSQIEQAKIETKTDSISVTVSIGVSRFEIKSESSADELVKELIAQADLALYAAKEAGRNCVARYPLN